MGSPSPFQRLLKAAKGAAPIPCLSVGVVAATSTCRTELNTTFRVSFKFSVTSAVPWCNLPGSLPRVKQLRLTRTGRVRKFWFSMRMSVSLDLENIHALIILGSCKNKTTPKTVVCVFLESADFGVQPKDNQPFWRSPYSPTTQTISGTCALPAQISGVATRSSSVPGLHQVTIAESKPKPNLISPKQT